MNEYRSMSLYCPDCNLVVDAKVQGTHVVMDSNQFVTEFDSDPRYGKEFCLCSCPKCQRPFLTQQPFVEIQAEFSGSTDDVSVIFPSRKSGDLATVPEFVSRPFSMALQSFQSGLYEPSVIMCRKCLEAICRQLNAKGSSLHHKLNDLRERQVIDKKLLDWADGLRVVGNDAAHDLDVQISKQDSSDALDFVEALLAYIFSLNRKFEDFKARRNKEVVAGETAANN